jgi:hypothetical protein
MWSALLLAASIVFWLLVLIFHRRFLALMDWWDSNLSRQRRYPEGYFQGRFMRTFVMLVAAFGLVGSIAATVMVATGFAH